MAGRGKRDIQWIPEHDQLLRELAQAGGTLVDIAKQMGRSPGSVRIRASRLNIRLATSGKFTACPAWLNLDEDRTSFVFLPDRAAVIRSIFEMSVAGLGGYTIAKQLNARNVTTFGSSPRWNQSTIHNLLRNRATIGEHQAKQYQKRTPVEGQSKQARDRKGTPNGEVVHDYYPAVIDEDLFNKAQEARRENLVSGRGRKGRLITNLFAGIPTCAYCAAPIKFHSNGNAKSLICSTVLEGRGCCRMGWSYRSFEDSFFRLVTEIELEQMAAQREADKATELKNLISEASGPNVYDARLALSLALKAAVSELKMSSAGSAPHAKKPDARIRRDDPARYFKVRFFGGPTHTIFPANK